MIRTVATSTAAVRRMATDLSSIIATLVVGAEVEQTGVRGDWVAVRTEDGREGWVQASALAPDPNAVEPSMATERSALQEGLDAAEQSQLTRLVTQIEQVAVTRQPDEPGLERAESLVRAAVKNYAFHAFIALFLYTFLWLPGLILNIIFLKAANRDQLQDGRPPQGKGCLLWLLWVFGIIPIVVIVVLIAIGFAVS